MACDFPLYGYRPPGGVGRLVFLAKNASPALYMKPVMVPCNKCRGCRLAKAAEWGVRCHHESQMHEHNSFLTLTYDDKHLPADFSVDPREFELFMKRLRKSLEPAQIRMFGCGEYGGKTFRPHYHSIIFGHDFPDKRLHGYTRRGHPIYRSAELEKLWTFGFSSIGAVNWRTAAYTARYTLKKINEEDTLPPGAKTWDDVRVHKAEYYNRVHPITGKLVTVRPEFLRMSRMPGLGKTWAQQYKSDWFPHDFVVLDNKKFPVPKYYTNLLSEDEQKFIKDHRRFEGNSPAALAEKNDHRRYVKKVVRDARIGQLTTREL